MTFGAAFSPEVRLTLSSAAVFLAMGRKIRRRSWKPDEFLMEFCGDVFAADHDTWCPSLADLQATDWEALKE